MDWSAEQYAKFLDERTRPARDLLAGVGLQAPRRIVDIGCGPGNSTALLVDRYPAAEVSGLDADPVMIAAAQKRLPACHFAQVRVEDWQPASPVDLIFANASLQWADDHDRLFPRLIGMLSPGGALAVQMPDNLEEPAHVMLRQVAADPRWHGRLAQARAGRKPLTPQADLHAMLRPLCRRVDVWRTTYHVELDGGIDAIVEWFRGSALGPYLQALTPEEQPAFLDAYRAAIAPFYPVREGRALLPFPRYFFVAEAL